MNSTFAGFSEEDLERIKFGKSASESNIECNIKQVSKFGVKTKPKPQYTLSALEDQKCTDSMENLNFEKCKLSIKKPTSPTEDIYDESIKNIEQIEDSNKNETIIKNNIVDSLENSKNNSPKEDRRKSSINLSPDIVRGIENYTEDELKVHKLKLDELQLQQKLMEEQNKKRKEMLAKALADRTKQTEDEVQRLEKIKNELKVLDGQFSHDVAMLRVKIDAACLRYAEAEKHYLKVEKEFLEAKINLQKEKEKKELLIEHLSTLITHNETRKAQKLENLMLELAYDKTGTTDQPKSRNQSVSEVSSDEETIIIDGVCQKTGKFIDVDIQQ